MDAISSTEPVSQPEDKKTVFFGVPGIDYDVNEAVDISKIPVPKSIHGMTSDQASIKKLDGHDDEKGAKKQFEKAHNSVCHVIPGQEKVDIIETMPDRTIRRFYSHKGDVTTIQWAMHVTSSLEEMFGIDHPIVLLSKAWADSNYARQNEDDKCVSWLKESPNNINELFTKIMTNSGEVTHISLQRGDKIFILDPVKAIWWLAEHTKVTNSPEALRFHIIDPTDDDRTKYYVVIEPRHDKDGTLKFGSPKGNPRAKIIDLLIDKSNSVVETVNII